MNIKSEINYLQKQLLDRLNVRKGSTLFTIIQEVSRQAYAKGSLEVSQKNSTLAKKCDVTMSTISRNLKKIKDKCKDIITIEQNRNTEEKFAALIFTFIPQKHSEQLVETSNGMSNGVQTEQDKHFNEPIEVSEDTFSLSTESQVLIENQNIDLEFSNVNSIDNSKIINDTYMEFAQKGINKALFKRVLKELENKSGIKNFKAYLRSCLNTVLYRIQVKRGIFDPMEKMKQQLDISNVGWYDWLNT